jgi:hypothetical protein
MKMKNKITALYERLSRDDCTPDDSVSIINQRKILEKYAAPITGLRMSSTTKTTASQAKIFTDPAGKL